MGQHSAPRVGARAAGAGVPGRAPRGAHRTFQLHRCAGHRQPSERRRLRQRGAGYADHLRTVSQRTRAAAGGSLGGRHQQEFRPDGRQQVESVWRSLLRQRHPAEAAADPDDQVGGEHECGARRRRSTGARRAHDAGARRRVRRVRLESLRVGSHARPRAEGEPREIAARLFQRSRGADQRRRADVLHDQRNHEPLRAVAAGRELLGHRHRALRRVFALSRRHPQDRSTRARAVAARADVAGVPRSHDAAGRPRAGTG